MASPNGYEPRGLVFDLDGTLIDSGQTILRIINDMRAHRRCGAVTSEQVRPHLSKGGERLVTLCLAEASGDSSEDLTDFRSRYAEIDQGPEIVYGQVHDILRHLVASRWRLAVCTNKPRDLTDKALSQTGLDAYFQTVVAGDDGYASKPSPDPLLECCRRLSVDPGETWFVGDSEVDQETASRAGCRFLFVEHGYPVNDPKLILSQARVARFEDLLMIIS